MQSGLRRALGCLVLVLLVGPAPQAEVLEEIVALVDGDILTKSEYDQEEQAMIQDIYRRLTGDELDQAVASVRRTLLMDLVDRKILVGRAGRMFDTERMGDVFYETFRDQQQVEDDAAFMAMLEREGMTVDDLKKRLISSFAPDEVVRYEVSSRVSVAEHEVDQYYAEHPEEFRDEDVVLLREIVLLADTDAQKTERRSEIDEIYAALTPETFAQTASEKSEAGTKDEGGRLGSIKRGDLATDLEQIAFGLKVGQWSDILERPYGFHVLFAEEVRVGEQRSLEDVRKELRLRLEDQRFAGKLREFLTKARGESEWCVKEKYVASMPESYTSQVCKEM